MADISSFLKKIKEAIYGEEVRGSIHDALAAMNEESSSAMEFAATAKDSAAASAEKAKGAEERVKAVKNEVEIAGAQATADAKAAQDAKAAAESARDSAKTSETNARNSEISAQQSKDTAENAKNAAQEAKQSAEDDALAAAQSKKDAEAAKLVAEQARDSAEEKAVEAAGSADKAEQYSGKPPKPQNGTWWIWNADTGEYYDTKISCELQGPVGNGIKDIQLTSGDHSPGTTDVYTVHMTDGSTYSISVYNGLNGTGAGDVLGITFDLVLPVSGWKDGAIAVADNRLLASATYKYLLSVYDASKDEFMECSVQPKDITTSGVLSFTCEIEPLKDITINLIRLELSGNGAAQ